MALAAIELDYTVEEVANRANTEGGTITGPISSRYARQVDGWKRLESHDDHRVREMARLGKQANVDEADRWKRSEEREELAEMYLE